MFKFEGNKNDRIRKVMTAGSYRLTDLLVIKPTFRLLLYVDLKTKLINFP